MLATIISHEILAGVIALLIVVICVIYALKYAHDDFIPRRTVCTDKEFEHACRLIVREIDDVAKTYYWLCKHARFFGNEPDVNIFIVRMRSVYLMITQLDHFLGDDVQRKVKFFQLNVLACELHSIVITNVDEYKEFAEQLWRNAQANRNLVEAILKAEGECND